MTGDSAAWSAWLAEMDTGLSEFFATPAGIDIAALDDPWTTAGFALLERHVKTEYETLATLRDPVHRPAVDRYVRYVGETYRRRCEGEWINSPQAEPGEILPAIRLPWMLVPLNPRNQVGSAFSRLPGRPPQGQLAAVLDTMTSEYTSWVDLGRPSAEQYGRLVQERIIAETNGAEL